MSGFPSLYAQHIHDQTLERILRERAKKEQNQRIAGVPMSDEQMAAVVASLRQPAPAPAPAASSAPSPTPAATPRRAPLNMTLDDVQIDPVPVVTPEQETSPPPEMPWGTESSSSVFDDPATTEAVLGMGSRNRQIALADEMRRAPSPEGRYVSGGRIYTAASPLEHLGAGYSKYAANKKLGSLEAEQMAAKQKLIEALRGARQPSTQSTMTRLPQPDVRMA